MLSHDGAPSAFRVWIFYVVMLAVAVVLFLLVRAYGETLAPSQATASPTVTTPGAPASSHTFFHVLLALAAVIVAGTVVGWLFRRIGQPPVIGEVVAGILLGPSLLGWLAPDAAEFILPTTTAPYLGVLAQLGVVLYMFLVGLELNAGLLREKAHATVAVSHASIVAPFVLGAVLALWLYPRLAPGGVPFTSFALFMGVAMSITAFPVLARILTDRRMNRSELGVVAMTCAATDDATAWCLLAFVVGVVQAQVGGAVLVGVLTLGYVALMFFAVRPVMTWLAHRYDDEPPRGLVAGVFLALLLSALTTEVIGVHALFGAFLLGAVIPHDSAIARAFTNKLEHVVTVLLLPAFFAFTGMRTQIGLVSGVENWLICGAIIVVATLGKFGGTLVAARWTGMGWRNAAALGTLMNTRGLMELIVLNVGLDLGVISPTLYAMMVLMALATTMATAPILQLLISRPATSSAARQAAAEVGGVHAAGV